jgi:hypothetical protein
MINMFKTHLNESEFITLCISVINYRAEIA